MDNRPESEKGSGSEKSQLEQLAEELEVIKRFHLRSILERGRDAEGMDEDQTKQIASYLRVIEKLIQVQLLRKKGEGLLSAPSVRLVWDVLSRVPELRMLLCDPEVKAKILEQIRSMIEEG